MIRSIPTVIMLRSDASESRIHEAHELETRGSPTTSNFNLSRGTLLKEKPRLPRRS
jgi:hypothetical protein